MINIRSISSAFDGSWHAHYMPANDMMATPTCVEISHLSAARLLSDFKHTFSVLDNGTTVYQFVNTPTQNKEDTMLSLMQSAIAVLNKIAEDEPTDNEKETTDADTQYGPFPQLSLIRNSENDGYYLKTILCEEGYGYTVKIKKSEYQSLLSTRSAIAVVCAESPNCIEYKLLPTHG